MSVVEAPSVTELVRGLRIIDAYTRQSNAHASACLTRNGSLREINAQTTKEFCAILVDDLHHGRYAESKLRTETRGAHENSKLACGTCGERGSTLHFDLAVGE